MINNKYIIDTKENEDFLLEQRESLLSFGKEFPSPFGGSYYLGSNGKPMKERARECWITCRMAHVYSIGSMLGYSECRSLAQKAVDGLLTGELRDKNHGGWFAGIDSEGHVLPTKQCYAHAFVILAGTSAYLAGIDGAKELLDEALAIYDKYFWDEKEGLAYDTYDTEFASLDSYRGLNANMHTVEAFLAVADALDNEEYRTRAGRIIGRVVSWAKNNNYRIPEHFNSDWSVDLDKNKDKPDDPFKPYGATPGHGIEWARLITQWYLSMTESLVDSNSLDNSEDYIEIAGLLFDRAVSDAWNADGARGICYTTDWEGKPVVHDRMHWTLAEAINTSAVLYRATGSDKYKEDYTQFMEYLDECVIDHVNGSWFHQLDEGNQLKETVWPGKSDLYHAFQATLIPYSDIKVSIAKAVKREENE